jgi:hypothetical protein
VVQSSLLKGRGAAPVLRRPPPDPTITGQWNDPYFMLERVDLGRTTGQRG